MPVELQHKSTHRPRPGGSSPATPGPDAGVRRGLVYRARCARCGQWLVPVRGPGRPAALCLPCDRHVVDLADARPAAYIRRCVVCGEWLSRSNARTCGQVCRQRLASARRRLAVVTG